MSLALDPVFPPAIKSRVEKIHRLECIASLVVELFQEGSL